MLVATERTQAAQDSVQTIYCLVILCVVIWMSWRMTGGVVTTNFIDYVWV